MARKKKEELPALVVVEMPKWKHYILKSIVWVLFLGKEDYFVITIRPTGFVFDGKWFKEKHGV